MINIFLLCSCNNTNSNQNRNKVISNNTIEKESINENFTVDQVVEYLCSDEVKDREYNTEGNKKVTEYINQLYKQLNLEFVFSKSYLDSFLYDDINISNVVGKINGKDDYPTEKAKFAFEQNMGVSDYFAFEENNYANIHICQQGVSEFILNENDTRELIDYEKIRNLANALSLYIQNVTL